MKQQKDKIRYIIANWKMHGQQLDMRVMQDSLCRSLSDIHDSNQIIICPPFTLLGQWNHESMPPSIHLGAQDCHHHNYGAFTGDISASMLVEAGCRYVILGHSERRRYHAETDPLIAAKALSAHQAGLIPIICIGETQEERLFQHTISVIEQQLQESVFPLLNYLSSETTEPLSLTRKGNIPSCLIAYEPVWAIGTGLVPELYDIEDVLSHIQKTIKKHQYNQYIPTIYGGSVNENNAASILDLTSVNGLLVGGASITFSRFAPIISV
jgi:triosephosphate isomerase